MVRRERKKRRWRGGQQRRGERKGWTGRERKGEEATRITTGPEAELTCHVQLLLYIYSAAHLHRSSTLHFHTQRCVRCSSRQLLVRGKANAKTTQNTTTVTMEEHFQ